MGKLNNIYYGNCVFVACYKNVELETYRLNITKEIKEKNLNNINNKEKCKQWQIGLAWQCYWNTKKYSKKDGQRAE